MAEFHLGVICVKVQSDQGIPLSSVKILSGYWHEISCSMYWHQDRAWFIHTYIHTEPPREAYLEKRKRAETPVLIVPWCFPEIANSVTPSPAIAHLQFWSSFKDSCVIAAGYQLHSCEVLFVWCETSWGRSIKTTIWRHSMCRLCWST